MPKLSYLRFASILFILVITVSCKSKNPSGGTMNQWEQDFAIAWNKANEAIAKAKKQQEDSRTFQIAISAHEGGNVEFAKAASADGEVYFVYKNKTTGIYTAYNLSKWDSATMSSFSQYTPDENDIVSNLERKEEWVATGRYEDIIESQMISVQEPYTVYDYVTKNEYDFACNCYQDVTKWEPVTKYNTNYQWKDVVVGQRYIDETGYYPFFYGGGFRFENAASAPKDLESYAASRELMTEGSLAAKFKNDFSLSTDRATELANLSMKYLKLENSRALTTQEKDHFAMKSLGVSMNQIETAMKSKAMGYDADYDSLLLKAAEVNKTTPEMIGKFFNTVLE